MEFVNKEDYNESFWDNDYTITLTRQGFEFVVNADNEQEAMDYLIDYIEDRPERWSGLLFAVDEGIDFPDDYISGGNHGRTLNTTNVRIVVKKRFLPTDHIVNQHTRFYGPSDFDGGVNYTFYKKSYFTEQGFDVDNSTTTEICEFLCKGGYYGGVGRLFKAQAWVTVRKNYVIVEQPWGYDV